MNILFQIDGGLGKSIMATAMVKVIKKRYKNANLIVVTAYPDVFLNNPSVSKVYTADYTSNAYCAGYVNTTTALTRVQFKFSSGNIDSGVIKMYGVGPKQS